MLTISLILLLILGYFVFFETMKIKQIDIRYDDVCETFRGTGRACKVKFTAEEDMVNPHVYYHLDNFYTNYRSFVKSRDNYQLRGTFKTLDEQKKCAGAKSYAELMNTNGDWFSP